MFPYRSYLSNDEDHWATYCSSLHFLLFLLSVSSLSSLFSSLPPLLLLLPSLSPLLIATPPSVTTPTIKNQFFHPPLPDPFSSSSCTSLLLPCLRSKWSTSIFSSDIFKKKIK